MTVIRATATLPVVLAMLSPLHPTVLDGITLLPATVESPLNLSIAIGDLDKRYFFEIYSRLRNFIYNLWYLSFLFCYCTIRSVCRMLLLNVAVTGVMTQLCHL